jgi:hypothetical protein
VQILSRLNRAHPQKRECFVPDLQNNSEAIAFAFQDENRTTLPTPKEVDLAKGILEAIDLDSYRVEKNAVMKISLADRDAETEPVPTDWEGHTPELERLHSCPGKLLQPLEVGVAGKQDEIVLNGQGRDPNVVCRDGGALLPELEEEAGEVMGGLLVGPQDPHPRPIQENCQGPLVRPAGCPREKTRPQLGKRHESHADELRGPHAFHGFWSALAEIPVPVGIEKDSHFHSSSSTWSISATTRSNSGSATQVPARSSRSL